MKSPDGNYFHIGRRLTLTLTLLIALILGGNGLVILQFERARIQTDRLTGVSQQLIAVLRLQESLLTFHQRLNELIQSKDAPRLVTEAEPLRRALAEQTQQTRHTLSYLPSEFSADPVFMTALDTIEISLPTELREFTTLAAAGDWEVVHLRLDDELRRIENTTSALVKNINRDLDEELPRAVANMRAVQHRIFLIVPATAISTVLIAAFFGWAIARRILELRLETRLSERTRIAGELHDTLLQSFQGLMMLFHTALDLMPARTPEAVKILEKAVSRGDQAITEGRNAIQDIRSSTMITNDLAQAMTALGVELNREPAPENSANFRVTVEGTARNLHPILRDEIYGIAREAVRNAFRHARAKRIEVEITYSERLLRLLVRDDGCGMNQATVDRGQTGHYGLCGMRERATRIGGQLNVQSALGAGTEVDLKIPGSIVYGTSPARTALGLFRKKAAQSHE